VDRISGWWIVYFSFYFGIRLGLSECLHPSRQGPFLINAVMFYAPKSLALGGVHLKMLGSVPRGAWGYLATGGVLH